MAKIMLVEDDNNLREIYEARLLAEGYEIISAKDGEEALAIAVKEKPDLIISDIMMPKISGFDMLDILRSTPETKDTKVIMMTALSQAEDKTRAEKLGADRYLVKSQVTLEDVAKVAREVLDTGASASASSPLSEPSNSTTSADPATVTPTSTTSSIPTTNIPVATPPTVPDDDKPATSTISTVPDTQSTDTEEKTVDKQIENFEKSPAIDAPQVTPTDESKNSKAVDLGVAAEKAEQLTTAVNEIMSQKTAPEPPSTSSSATPTAAVPESKSLTDASVGSSSSTSHGRVILPMNDLTTKKPDLNALLQAEDAEDETPNNAPKVINVASGDGEDAPAVITPTESSVPPSVGSVISAPSQTSQTPISDDDKPPLDPNQVAL